MILEDIVILAAATTRTIAYIQEMAKNNFFPSLCIIITDNIEELRKEKENVSMDITRNKYFNDREPLIKTLENYNIEYLSLKSKDVNSTIVCEMLSELKQRYIIYSGYGGSILKEHLFEIDKIFIHIHAGELPAYRGSTTAYYSILKDKSISATAIVMSKGIDEGNIIVSKKFPVKSIEIDYIYEPHVRSLVLIEALKIYIEKGEFPISMQKEEAETYYIIHPVLKHIAILSLENE